MGAQTGVPVSTVIAGMSLVFGLTWFLVNELSVKPFNKISSKFKLHEVFDKEYVLIKPKKEAFSILKMKKVEKTYRIWIPVEKTKKNK